MSDLEERVLALENAITTLARVEFGDSPGHAFRGNQYGAAAAQAEGRETAYRELARGADPSEMIKESRIASNRATQVADRAYHEGRIETVKRAIADKARRDEIQEQDANWAQSPNMLR